MLTLINRFGRDESGANMVEYALLVGLIAVVAGTGASKVGLNVNAILVSVATYLGAITVPASP